MASVTRTAEVDWEGSVGRGGGAVRLASSGAGGELRTSLPTRAGEPQGQTSPEELIAAAHASCFAMSVAAVLTRRRTPPELLEVSAAVTERQAEGGGFEISRSELRVRGRVAGIDAEAFAEAAREAESTCPVSNALRGNVEITLDASLAG